MLQQREHFAVVRVPALLLLREDQFPVRHDVVLALRALAGNGVESL
ncbi:MAG TPA: hypothetical protein VLE97_00190 [Gaiellaceae bacterium]|nr:hypothetical protein [Gaiellaceae bacterium]